MQKVFKGYKMAYSVLYGRSYINSLNTNYLKPEISTIQDI